MSKRANTERGWRALCAVAGVVLLWVLAPLASAPAAAAAAGRTGKVLLVSVAEPRDEGLRRRLAGLCEDPAERLVLELVGAGEESRIAGSVALRLKSARQVEDLALVRRVRSARVIELHGGSFMGWFDTLLPRGQWTRLALALRDATRRGATLVGFGEAAGFLAGGTTITREELKRSFPREERNPHKDEPQRSVVGLALGPPVLYDGDARPEGTPVRLLHALWKTKADRGVWTEGEVLLEYDSDTGVLVNLGPGPVVLYELRMARRKRSAVREGRVSLLTPNDRWVYGEARVRPASDAQALPAWTCERKGQVESKRDLLVEGPLSKLLTRFAREGEWSSLEYRAHGRTLTLRADERASRHATGELCRAHEVAFDVVWEGVRIDPGK